MQREKINAVMKEHFIEMDTRLDQMVYEDYSHESIHNFRESIRRFRALLYLIKPLLSHNDYQLLERCSKHNFDRTSLIREIDVFEHGYGYYMRRATLEKLSLVVAPLIERIRNEGAFSEFNKFSDYKINLKNMTDIVMSRFMITQYNTLKDAFLQPVEIDNEEKAIHSKRMYVKKIKYIHDITHPNDKGFEAVNECLEKFQEIAKKLHDVCVNLRFIGQYQLEDPVLLERLIKEHGIYQKASENQYTLVRESMKKAPHF